MLLAVREALREEKSGEVAVLDRLLGEGKAEPLNPAEAFRVFALLIGIEWRRGKWTRYGGMAIHDLVRAWRTQSGIGEGDGL